MFEVDQDDLRKILADHHEMARLFDLSRNELGTKLLDCALSGVQVTALVEEDVDDQPLAPLSPEYAAWKATHYPGQRIGVREGLMQDYQQMFGIRTIETAAASWEYGQDQNAKDELAWFQEGSNNRPPRPIFGLTEDAIRKSDAICDAVFAAAFS